MAKEKKEARFVEKHVGSFFNDTRILVDRKTGVNYLWHCEGYAGGLTPLLNRDGTPVVSPLPLSEE